MFVQRRRVCFVIVGVAGTLRLRSNSLPGAEKGKLFTQKWETEVSQSKGSSKGRQEDSKEILGGRRQDEGEGREEGSTDRRGIRDKAQPKI